MSYNVTGKSINDLMNISSKDFGEMSKEDLRAVTQRLASAANKRLDRMTKAGEKSPAMRSLEKSGGRISTKGKDKDQLKVEYTRAKNFLNSKTSSLAGWNKVKKEASRKAKERELLKREQRKKEKIAIGKATPSAPAAPTPAPTPPPITGVIPSEDMPTPEPPMPEPEPPIPEPEEPEYWEPEEPEYWEPEEPEYWEPEEPEEPELSSDQDGKLWGIIDDILDADPRFADRALRYHLHNIAAEIKINNRKMNYKQIKSNIKKRIEAIYNEIQEEQRTFAGGGLSSFFFGPSL